MCIASSSQVTEKKKNRMEELKKVQKGAAGMTERILKCLLLAEHCSYLAAAGTFFSLYVIHVGNNWICRSKFRHHLVAVPGFKRTCL